MTDEKRKESITRNKQKLAEKRAGKGIGIGKPTSAGSGPLNRHGEPQLPPGQHEVKDWPVLDLGIHPEVAVEDWYLKVDGLVANALDLDWPRFMELPQIEDTSDFHCVTTWSLFDSKWKGVRLRDLLHAAGVRPEGKYVFFESHDGYTTNISMEEAVKDDVLVVHEWNGAPLPREHGGPARVITPQLYAWKGAKWIRHITVLAEDRLGYWEERGYSNTALPWQDDRYSNGKPPTAD